MIESEKNQKNNYFSFESEKQIKEYQKNETGICFPHKTKNVLEIDMLFGKNFKSNYQSNKIFSTIEVKDTTINCNLSNVEFKNLSNRANINDPILIQVQLRGSGKTNQLYTLGKERDMVYIDFSCNEDGSLAKLQSVNYLFLVIKDLMVKIKSQKSLRIKSQETLDIFLLSNIIHNGIFREVFKDSSSEYFLRYSINGGQRIITDLFQELLIYKIKDLHRIVNSFKNDVIIGYDEVGCLTNLFLNTFLRRDYNEKTHILKDSLRGFFHIFADSVINLRSFNYYQSNFYLIYKY
jgi:hypothetical protein